MDRSAHHARKKAARPLALFLVSLGGCTLLVQGTSQDVKFTSEPPGAVFFVEGQTLTTPATVTLPKEDQEVVFKRPGYQDASVALKRKISLYFWGSVAMGVLASSVDIISGAWKEFETTDVHVNLAPLADQPADLPVTIRTEPPGAEVLVGEVRYGKSPREVILTWQPNDREKPVTVRLAGFTAQTVPLRREDKELSITLDALPRTVTVRFTSKPDGAEVRMGDRVLGRTPFSADLVWGPKDAPRPLEVSLKGYRDLKRQIKPDEPTVTLALEEVVEQIPFSVKVTPVGAAVAIDGVPAGEAPVKAPLAWSITINRHKVVISHPGYATRTLDVTRDLAEKGLDVRLSPSVPGDK
jgi:hypothetical protein